VENVLALIVFSFCVGVVYVACILAAKGMVELVRRFLKRRE
jgi:hypothetical protein